jgi:hypothetical protein
MVIPDVFQPVDFFQIVCLERTGYSAPIPLGGRTDSFEVATP